LRNLIRILVEILDFANGLWQHVDVLLASFDLFLPLPMHTSLHTHAHNRIRICICI